jgi:NAD(P)H-dependent flavin oxidoreductase YrpB (nitropropane dioxygenase family)
MGGGLAGPELAAGVAVAGGLGTLGLAPPAELREAIRQVRDAAPDRSVAVNLLMPFVRRKHVQACVESGIDVAVIAFGMDRTLLQWLSEHGVFVFVMVGTDEQARRAIACGTDGLIAQGCEAGGHIAGGVAAADDTRAAMAAGAAGVVAGMRFLLTDEARAHRGYQRRILAADKTFRAKLFGLGWPAPHRVVANAATRRWCHDDGRVKLAPRLINAGSGALARLGDRAIMPVLKIADAAPADVLPRCPNDRDARVGGGPHGAVHG